ncbi:MAG: GAF domain-containing protein [Desulfobulbaceae bacterium]|nr:GAF domain-containing protein [Desulfobulbaceae bacterium]
METLPTLARMKGLLDSVLRISEIINNPRLSYNKRMDRVLKIVLDYLGAEQGSIMVLERKKLVVRAATRPEIIGLKQAISDDSVAGSVAKYGEALFIPDISVDKRFKQRQGDIYIKNSLLSVPILHDGKVTGVINITDKAGSSDLLKEDISYLLQFSSMILWSLVQQNLHREVQKQRTILRRKNRELDRQEEMRSQLSRLLIHDLKTPLAEIIANLDILSYSIDENNREFLDGARLGCDRAVRMISNLVTIDKIEADGLILLKEEVRPHELLAESLSGIRGLARIKNIAIVEKCAELPAINIDRILILRVLQNILSNGLSYSEADSTITAGCRRVGDKKEIEFYIEDQGSGIPASQRRVIFDKYARIARTHDFLTGSGLGLYFCKLAVECHRGMIGVDSESGRGSRFFFTLPL